MKLLLIKHAGETVTAHKIFFRELRDFVLSVREIIEALPKMAEAADRK